MFRRPLALTLGAAGLIAGVACGSETDGAAVTSTTESTPAESTSSVAPGSSTPTDSGDTSTSTPSPTTAPEGATAPVSFPSVQMVDLATGESTDLAELSLPNQSILAWFWAPH